jgi:YVTN family beta-propeller protein
MMAHTHSIALAALSLLLVPTASVLPAPVLPGQGGAQAPVYRSPIHISLSPDGRRAFVVNHTSDSVSVIDVPARQVVGEFPVGSSPAHAVVSPDGRALYVTNRFGSAVEIVDLEEERVVRTLQAGYEPYGMALSSDGRRLYVANSQSDTVSIIALESGETLRQIPVGREPRYLAETGGGTQLIVGNSLSRGVSIIDVATGRLVESRTLGRASIVRDVVCSHDGPWAFVAHVISHDEQIPLQMERGWIHSNGLSVLDLRRPGHYVTLLLDRILVGAANPWGLALSADDRWLYVSLAGVHQIAIVDVEKALSLVKETGSDDVEPLSQDVEIVENRHIARRVEAGGIGPRGLALSEATGEILVANYFSDTVSVLDAATGVLRAVIPLGAPQETTLERRGEMLFNDARLCFQQWFSCASCHEEDATIDGLNWDLANDGLGNPKNVKSLHDAHDTPPAMWTGVREDMEAAVAAGERFLGFLPEPENHRALLAFITSPRRAPNPYRDRNPDAVRRGEQIFQKARCPMCHPAPEFTDQKMHDLGMAGRTDFGSRFDTPALRECYRTAPYLHDGRAGTLLEIFTEHNPDNLHGLTRNLTKQELDDLVEYLRSL